MALKFTQKNPSGSGGGGTYDHSLLINRGLPDQHTIESITGLREALTRKYEKPLSGIPKSDLAFDVATLSDIDNLRQTDIYNINELLQHIVKEVVDARGEKETLKEYIDSKVSYNDWSGNGGTGDHDGSGIGYPLYQEFRASEGQTRFEFTEQYRVGTRQLEVYLNGLRMVVDNDYIESTDSSIEFTFTTEEDDHVLAMVRTTISSGLHEEHVATEGQMRFTLANPYAIYQNTLQVFRNGNLQRKGRDYRELTEFIIEFYYGLEKGNTITFHQAGSTDPIAGVILESEIGRLKMSNAQMSIAVQDITGVEATHSVDMYVDAFITDNAFDKGLSFDFVYQDRTIMTGETDIKKDTYEEFRLGIQAGTDYSSFSNRVVLLNTNGGSEGNVFAPPVPQTTDRGGYEAGATIVLSNRSIIHLTAERVEMGNIFLHVVQEEVHPDRSVTKVETDIIELTGSISNFDYAILKDEAHIVFTHTNSEGKSAIYYFTATATSLSELERATEYVDKADHASIAVDNSRVVIAFDSERIQAGVRNIEYITKTDKWSGIIHLTSDTDLASKNPSILLHKKMLYIAYDTLLIDGLNANICLTTIDPAGHIVSENVTTLDFDNVKPKMKIGSDEIIRIAWLSNRLSGNKGIDFVFVYSNGDISATRTVMSPTSSMYCSDLRIAVDYQNITHIVFVSNEQSVSVTNIVYAYVTENNVVTDYGNIIKDAIYNITSPSISLIADTILVSGISKKKYYRTTKSIANYLASGYYTIEFDGLSKDTKWLSYSKVDYIPVGTGIKYEVRVSNDRHTWSEWADVSIVNTDNPVGQYLQLRAHMTSNYFTTPEIHALCMRCEPNMTRIQTVPKKIEKDIQNCIVMADYEGEIDFFVSRDGGETFISTMLDRTTNLLGTSSTQSLVLRAEMQKGSQLKSWALIW